METDKWMDRETEIKDRQKDGFMQRLENAASVYPTYLGGREGDIGLRGGGTGRFCTETGRQRKTDYEETHSKWRQTDG